MCISLVSSLGRLRVQGYLSGLTSIFPIREGREDIFANLCPVFRQLGEGQRASSQLSSAQNKLAYSATFHDK